MHTALDTIQLLVAPVVMISACGLLCLALYNRLAAMVSRARAFHKEQFDAMARLKAADNGHPDPAPIQHLRRRVELLDVQVAQILRRAGLVRNALILLLSTVLCMLGCSIALGLSLLSPVFTRLALACFLLGIGTMSGAIVLALRELTRALDPVLLEQTAVDEIEPL
jgi:hypothetical protein